MRDIILEDTLRISTGKAALEKAHAWSRQDPDPSTCAELQSLITAAEAGSIGAVAELDQRFAARLEFGTAGLRGELGAGPSRMNRVLVAQTAAGLAAFLKAREPQPSIVIGYDGRHSSDVFARDTAEIMQGAGVRVTLLPRLLPTPVLAYAVRHLGASAGVMVTASHNPARDNGYKVYLGGDDNGSQIVSPADSEIEAEILRVAEGSIADLPRLNDYATADEDLINGYVHTTAALATHGRPLAFTYTPLHGVGWETARRVFAVAGFGEPSVVTEQLQPDPEFPTASFPNPEEPGVMDLAFTTATGAGSTLVIANDPDADRLAVGIPDASAASGWRRLTGNEVGSLLGWREAKLTRILGKPATLAASVVSSPALAEVAHRYGLAYAETLTGFKWISRAPDLAFGYEEALGYLVDPGTVRDKDGISAAVVLLDLAAELDAAGSTIGEALIEFAEEIGGYASTQISLRVQDQTGVQVLMARLRSAPPREVGGIRVDSVEDFSGGLGDLPPSDILRFNVADSGRVLVRPSGTEPKLKVYIDAVSHNGSGAERIATAERIVATLGSGMRKLLA